MKIHCCESMRVFTQADEYEDKLVGCVPTLNETGHIKACDATFERNDPNFDDYPEMAVHVRPIQYCPWCGTNLKEIIIDTN